jgi:methyl-accepting chemotaxis protein
MVQAHDLIDKEVDKQLKVILHDTSESSFAIIGLMKTLNAANQNIGKYVNDVSNQIESMESGVDDSVKYSVSMISKNQKDIAEQVAEILGSIQYQDIVRQRIERMQAAMQRRNDLFQLFVTELESSGGSLVDDFATQMNMILNDYIEEEAHHNNSLNPNAEENQPPKFELF